MMVKVGFTGTRQGMTKEQMAEFKRFLKRNIVEEFHHGKCIGADSQAHQMAWDEIMVMKIVIHPPGDTKHEAVVRSSDSAVVVLPRAPYLQRNKDIVDATEILIAAPRTMEEEERSGTWHTIRYARKIGRKVIIIAPDGRLGETIG